VSFLWYWPAGGWDFDGWKKDHAWEPIESEQSGQADPIPLVTDGMTAQQWQQKETPKWRKVSEQILGSLSDGAPTKFRYEPLGATYRTDKYSLRRYRYTLTDEEWGYAWLMTPNERRVSDGVVIAHHQTVPSGKDEPAALDVVPEADASVYYAKELVDRGFVTLVPDAIAFGERQAAHRNSKYKSADQFFAAQPHGSVMGKMAFDTSRAIDFLKQLPDVNAKRIGCVGHSHGAYGTLFAMVADPRIDAGVMSCGVSLLRDDPSPDRWWRRTSLIPRLGYYEGSIAKTPIDFHIWLALAAPRPVMVIGGKQDTIFPNQAALPKRLEEVRKVYRLLGRPDGLEEFVFDGPHRFHETARARGYALLERALTV
jgi:dienelactone hydrolase